MKHKDHTQRKSFRKWAAPICLAAPQSFTRNVVHFWGTQTIPLTFNQSAATRVGINLAKF